MHAFTAGLGWPAAVPQRDASDAAAGAPRRHPPRAFCVGRQTGCGENSGYRWPLSFGTRRAAEQRVLVSLPLMHAGMYLCLHASMLG